MPKAYNVHVVYKMILQCTGHIALCGINGSLSALINQIFFKVFATNFNNVKLLV